MNAPDELALLRAELAELRDEVRALRARELSPRFAAIYPAFEDRFRGTEADVRERLAVYLPEVRSCVRADAGGPRVLDLGPGRGEWLALLADAGVPARGVDDNGAMVEHLRGRGLDVAADDAACHLAALPDGALDVITAFHVVEHLDLESTLGLLAHAARVLRPGGLLVLETPHPANLVMGACNFYLDPTHRSRSRPPGWSSSPPRAASPTSGCGSCTPEDVDLAGLRLTGVGAQDTALLAAALQKGLFGPQDYALLARTPE